MAQKSMEQNVNLSLFAVAKAALQFEIALGNFKIPEWFLNLNSGSEQHQHRDETFPFQAARYEAQTKRILANPFPKGEIPHMFAFWLLQLSNPDDSYEDCETIEKFLEFSFDSIWGTFPCSPSSSWLEGYDEDVSWNQAEWFAIQGLDENGDDPESKAIGNWDSPAFKAWSQARIEINMAQGRREAAHWELLNGLQFANAHDTKDEQKESC